MHDGFRRVGKWRSSQAQAARDEAEMLQAIALGTWDRSYGPHRVPTFSELADQHLEEFDRLVREGKRAASTATRKRQHLTALKRELGERRIDLITRLDIERLKRKLHRSLSGPTVNRYLATASSVFRAAAGICANPVSGVERYEENTDRWADVTPEEAATLIAKAGADPNANMRPLLVLIFEAALRSNSEALPMRWDQIDWAWRDRRGARRGLITLPTTKAGEVQSVPMSKRLATELRAWRRRTPGALVFPGRTAARPMSASAMYDAWERIKKAAGFPASLRLHDFRHGRATSLIRAGAPRAQVQRLLRHKTRVMTDRYVHMTEFDAAAALEHGEKVAPFERKEKRRDG